MYSLSQISPPGENRPASVDPGEKAQLPGLGNGIVNPVADGDQAGCKKAGPSFCPGKKILEHLVIWPSVLLTHVQIAHGGHDHPVFQCHAVDPYR